MASFSGPNLGNRMADDVPAIQVLLSSLAKLTPDSGNTDYPVGTKRLSESANGYEFQQWNGTNWVTLESWNINVQKVDGFSASTGTIANTIPVRDADGRLPGDLAGNAASATTAGALSETNPIGKGGTGATTVTEARNNLGVPPINHASMGTDFGIGTSTYYGHVMILDSTSNASDASTGIAASPKAVKAAYDRGTEGITAAATVQTNLTASISTQASRDAEQDTAITAVRNAMIPSGTKMLFNQSAAPTGWTKQTGVDNAALRVVSGTTGGGTGGSIAFSTLFATGKAVSLSGNVGATTLTTAQMPSHKHKIAHTQSYYYSSTGADALFSTTYSAKDNNYPDAAVNILNNTGSSSSHTHTLSGTASIALNVKYTDVIICKKD